MSVMITQETLANLMNALEIQMSDEQKTLFAEHLNDTLPERIGTAIVELLDDDQVDEYLSLVESNNSAKLSNWLRENVPDLDDVISDEIDILLGDIAEHSDNI